MPVSKQSLGTSQDEEFRPWHVPKDMESQVPLRTHVNKFQHRGKVQTFEPQDPP